MVLAREVESIPAHLVTSLGRTFDSRIAVGLPVGHKIHMICDLHRRRPLLIVTTTKGVRHGSPGKRGRVSDTLADSSYTTPLPTGWRQARKRTIPRSGRCRPGHDARQ